MKNTANVDFVVKAISVNDDVLFLSSATIDVIKDVLPETVENKTIGYIMWFANNPSQTCFATENGEAILFEPNEENYNKWVKPYVDIWQAEKDRLEQEQIQAQQEYAKFENRKERALDKIVGDYHSTLANGFVRTSMGFDADISPDSVATLSATNLALNRNLLAEESPKTVFRDFYGLERTLDKVQVELLICQINAAQNHIRELKYAFKTKVKETYDNDSLNTVLDTCVYSTLDFSKPTGEGKPSVMPFEQPSTYVERIDTF